MVWLRKEGRSDIDDMKYDEHHTADILVQAVYKGVAGD